MSLKKVVQSANAPAAIGPYSQGIAVNGFYFFSGMLGIDPSTGNLSNTANEQTAQVFKNIDALLESEKLSRAEIVKTTVFVKDLNDFPIVNEAFKSYFEAPYPARSTVEVARLPKDALVEIEIIASRNT